MEKNVLLHFAGSEEKTWKQEATCSVFTVQRDQVLGPRIWESSFATKTYPTGNLLLTTNPVQLCVRERRKFIPSLALEPAAVLYKIPGYLLPFGF